MMGLMPVLGSSPRPAARERDDALAGAQGRGGDLAAESSALLALLEPWTSGHVTQPLGTRPGVGGSCVPITAQVRGSRCQACGEAPALDGVWYW